MPKFGIVAALEREVEEFTRKSAVSHRVHDGRTVKVFERGDTVLVCSGIGRQAARRATEALITLWHPETVQSVGYAGALTPALKVGELIRPARITDAGDGSSLEIGHGHGILVTASCTATSEQKRRFAEMYRADAVDMEAAAVAKGARRGVYDSRPLKLFRTALISTCHRQTSSLHPRASSVPADLFCLLHCAHGCGAP